MSGSPRFAELEKARKPQKGEAPATGLRLSDSIWLPPGTSRSAKPPDTHPAAAARTPLATSQAGARSPMARAPTAAPSRQPWSIARQLQAGICFAMAPAASPCWGAAGLLCGWTAQPGSDARAWPPPATAALAGTKPLPGVKSQLVPSFAANTTSHPAPHQSQLLAL